MTRPYSMDLRRRVVEAVLGGATVREAASRFGVAVSSAVKWTKRQRQTGSIAPGKIGGHRRPLLQGEARAWLLRRLAEKPDLTVRALQAELLQRGIKVGHNTVWVCLKAEGLSSKKNRAAARTRSASHSPLSNEVERPSASD